MKFKSELQNMMQDLGIPCIEFADENGKVKGRIEAPKPKNIPCDVPAYGGGVVSIRQGDRIRLWFRNEKEWTMEKIGTVISISPDRHIKEAWSLVYDPDNRKKTSSFSSCLIQCPSCGWARVVEKL